MTESSQPVETPSELRTFLVADIRGYTKFTEEHGDEAAAQLASTFAGIVRVVVEARGGRLLELRGDEALAVFGSARGALRAALDLQEQCSARGADHPSLPLPIGIGLDAGEAVPVEGGYRGAALNLAARLCSQARPGEVLAAEGLVHLAGKTDGIALRDRGRIALKGVANPVRVYRVVPEGDEERPLQGELVPAGKGIPPAVRPEPDHPTDWNPLEAQIERTVAQSLRGLDEMIHADVGEKLARAAQHIQAIQSGHERGARPLDKPAKPASPMETYEFILALAGIAAVIVLILGVLLVIVLFHFL